jgi:hypothetical protein
MFALVLTLLLQSRDPLPMLNAAAARIARDTAVTSIALPAADSARRPAVARALGAIIAKDGALGLPRRKPAHAARALIDSYRIAGDTAVVRVVLRNDTAFPRPFVAAWDMTLERRGAEWVVTKEGQPAIS